MSKKILIQLSKISIPIILVVLALFATYSIGSSQVTPTGTGPGGVGTNDGGSSLELWVQADNGAFTDTACTAGSEAMNDNDTVQCWQDQSGNGADLTVNGTAPAYFTNQFNPITPFPALRFSDDVLENNFTSTNDDFSIFIVSDSNGAQNQYAGLFASTVGVDAGSFQIDAGGPFGCTGEYRLLLLNNVSTSIPVCSGTYDSNPTITTALGSDIIADTYDDSSLQNSSSFGTLPHFENFAVGRNRNTDQFWNGDIAEVIVYFDVLPDVQRILVENYLSAKYAIDISASGNDYYTSDTIANGNFDFNVAGIGQLNAIQNSEAHSAGMIVVNNTFLSDDGDWLLFGHRTLNVGNTQTGVPTTGDWASAPNPQRWIRNWAVDITDAGTAGGTVDIIFDFSEGEMDNCCPPSGPATNYRLLRRDPANSSNQFTEIITATATIVGDQVQFLGVNVNDLQSSFTLGTLNFTDSPTAVTMQDFTVSTTTAPMLIIGSLLILALISMGIIFRKREEL